MNGNKVAWTNVGNDYGTTAAAFAGATNNNLNNMMNIAKNLQDSQSKSYDQMLDAYKVQQANLLANREASIAEAQNARAQRSWEAAMADYQNKVDAYNLINANLGGLINPNGTLSDKWLDTWRTLQAKAANNPYLLPTFHKILQLSGTGLPTNTNMFPTASNISNANAAAKVAVVPPSKPTEVTVQNSNPVGTRTYNGNSEVIFPMNQGGAISKQVQNAPGQDLGEFFDSNSSLLN